jgi:hypothetical protein
MNDEDEARLDETIEESFPASDSPANTPETGVGARRLPPVIQPPEQHGEDTVIPSTPV